MAPAVSRISVPPSALMTPDAALMSESAPPSAPIVPLPLIVTFSLISVALVPGTPIIRLRPGLLVCGGTSSSRVPPPCRNTSPLMMRVGSAPVELS